MNTKWLRDRRKVLNLTQEDVSARLQIAGFDFTAGAISHWETGRHGAPLEDPDFCTALADALRMSVAEVLSLSGYKVSEKPQSEEARRAAYIVDQLPPDQRNLALGILEQFLKTP